MNHKWPTAWECRRQGETTALKTYIGISSSIIHDMFKTKLSSGASSSPIGSPGGTVLNYEYAKKLNVRSNIKIGTWNVRTLAQSGRAHNAIKEMERLKINILGISEMRWPGSNFCDINEHRVYYSGTTNGKYEYGVGIIMKKTIAKHVTNFIPISERIMLLQVRATPANLNLIQVYAPTCQHGEDEVEEFYSQIKEVLKDLSKQDLTMIMGDWNAKIGKGRAGDIIGPHGLGKRNERGELCELVCGGARINSNKYMVRTSR